MKAKTERPLARTRWVIKVGSNIVCSGGLLLIRSWMQQLAILRKDFNVEVIWVTSGAIASAIQRTGFKKRNRLLPEKQALSAIGQPMIMEYYNLALQASGMVGGQILLSYGDLEESERSQNFRQTVEKLLDWGVVPILNENDAVATEEIKFGDNDNLSARVAHYTQADRLVILTDVDGLYDSNPKLNSDARLIRRASQVSERLLSYASTSSSGSERNFGTGGMFSKLSAAKYASERGIETWLVKGDLPHLLVRIAKGEAIGTTIGSGTKNHSGTDSPVRELHHTKTKRSRNGNGDDKSGDISALFSLKTN